MARKPIGEANNAITAADTALSGIAEFTEAVALIQAAVAEIEAKKGTVIGEIETTRDAAMAEIQVKQAQAVAAIQLEQSGALQAVRAGIPNIAQMIQNAIDTWFGRFKGY